jgi:hypothetical protein
MSHLPGGCKTRVYNAQERAAIDPFKANYLAARKIIAQNHIFLALWNHWVSIGWVLDEGETHFQTEVVLSYYRRGLIKSFFHQQLFIGFAMFGECQRRSL